jgi:hypothetical protein
MKTAYLVVPLTFLDPDRKDSEQRRADILRYWAKFQRLPEWCSSESDVRDHATIEVRERGSWRQDGPRPQPPEAPP